MTDYAALAARLGCEPRALEAVAEVESAGSGFLPDGQPVIRFEGHIFNSRTGGRFAVSNPDVATQHWRDEVRAGRSYDGLGEARLLDETAALESCSWGAFQVMGFHWRAFGMKSVRELVALAKTTEGQLELFALYVRAVPLSLAALQRKDWRQFALHYNGAGQQDEYARRMSAAYQRLGSMAGDGAATEPVTLREGMSGPAVTALQARLKALDFNILIDGQFGPQTVSKVRDYQGRRGLAVDGVVGPKTRAALGL